MAVYAKDKTNAAEIKEAGSTDIALKPSKPLT
jgi:hypothetical protein